MNRWIPSTYPLHSIFFSKFKIRLLAGRLITFDFHHAFPRLSHMSVLSFILFCFNPYESKSQLLYLVFKAFYITWADPLDYFFFLMFYFNSWHTRLSVIPYSQNASDISIPGIYTSMSGLNAFAHFLCLCKSFFAFHLKFSHLSSRTSPFTLQ